MSKDTIIFTPEAIAERIFEDWKEKTTTRLLSFSHQYVDLEQGSLYYAAMGLDVDENDEDLIQAKFCNRLSEFKSVLKEVGQYDKIGIFADRDSCKFHDKLALFENVVIYLQIKDSNLEKYVLELFEDTIPSKLSKNMNFEIRYHEDKSGDINYHEASNNPQMHIYLIPNKNPSNKTKVLDTTFNLLRN